MKKIICAAAVILAVCMALTGCSGAMSLENSNLMRPPRATGDRAQIQSIIDGSAGGSYTFKYPQGGDYRSAIIMHDMTGDNTDEAIAIYRTSGEDAETHVIIIDEINETWSLVGDFRNSSPEVSHVIFADLDNDGSEEIIVGYSTYSSLVSSLAVYSYNGLSSQNITVNETYSNLILGDFTGNGTQEIVLVSMENNGILAGAKLLYYSKENNALMRRSEVEMDSGVSKFISIGYNRISNDTFGIVADGQSVDNNYYTQLIYFDKTTGQLRNSLYDAQNENKSMHRQDSAVSMDIDGDGITEIPISSKMPFDPSTEVEELVANELVYYQYNTGKSTFIEEEHFISNPGGYLYRIPDELKGNITARIDPTTGVMTVFTILDDNSNEQPIKRAGDLMFTLRAFEPDKWEANGEYRAVCENDSQIIGLAVPEGDPFGILQSDIQSNILIL